MRNWRDVDDLRHFYAAVVERTNRRFASVSGPLHEDLHFLQTRFHRASACIFGRHLSSVRRIFLRASKAHFTRRRPRNDLTGRIGQRDDDVVEGRIDVRFAMGFNLDLALLDDFR